MSEPRMREPILKLSNIKKGLVSGLDIMALATAAIRLKRKMRDSPITIKIPTPKVGNTAKKAPIAAPEAISFTLPIALVELTPYRVSYYSF